MTHSPGHTPPRASAQPRSTRPSWSCWQGKCLVSVQRRIVLIENLFNFEGTRALLQNIYAIYLGGTTIYLWLTTRAGNLNDKDNPQCLGLLIKTALHVTVMSLFHCKLPLGIGMNHGVLLTRGFNTELI